MTQRITIALWLLAYSLLVQSVVVTDELSLIAAFEKADAETIIEVNANEIKLHQSIHVSTPNITLKGIDASRSILSCPENDRALLINVSFNVENMIFANCIQSPVLDIQVTEPNHSVRIKNCEFRSNSLNSTGERIHGASIMATCSEGCLQNVLQLQISGCLFENNTADQGGALFAIDSGITITDTQFIENVANFGGSAIFARQTNGEAHVNASVILRNCHFSQNRALEVGLGPPLKDFQGKPLEIVNYMQFESPLATGGACLLKDIRVVSMKNCTFNQNQAAAGGAVSIIYDETKTLHAFKAPPEVEIMNCTFNENKASHSGDLVYTGSREVRHGGALYLSFNLIEISVEIKQCTFEGNQAYFGGAIHVVGANSIGVVLEQSNFNRNSAKIAGGAVLARFVGELSWNFNNATENRAQSGGAIFLTNYAGFKMEGLAMGDNSEIFQIPSHLINNSALSGGALACARCGDLNIQNAQLISNRASHYGGALYAVDHDLQFVVQYTRAELNQAYWGGAIAAEASRHLVLDINDHSASGNIFRKNMACSGGAIFYKATRQNQNAVSLRGCKFHNNKAVSGKEMDKLLRGVELRLVDDLPLREENASRDPNYISMANGGGGAVCLEISSVPLSASVYVSIENSNFLENEARVGGGCFIDTPKSEWNSVGNTRCTPDATLSRYCRNLQFQNVNFTKNVGIQGGGAVFVSNAEHVECACDPLSASNATLRRVVQTFMRNPNASFEEELFCTSFYRNSVEENGGGYGPHVATNVNSLKLVYPKSPIVDHNSGKFLVCNGEKNETCRGYTVLILDQFQQKITGGNPAAELEINVESESLNGNTRYTAKNGIVNVNQVKGITSKDKRNPETPHTIRFFALDNPNLVTETKFFFRDCRPGEVSDDLVCRLCTENYYSFKPSVNCLQCEVHANCTGGATLIPEDGYWHSTPFSPLFHECLVEDACKYSGRYDSLYAFYNDGELNITDELKHENVYQQCRPGYMGALCGSCVEGYGRFSDGSCSKCEGNQRLTFGVMILLALWITALISFEVVTTLHTNHEFKKLQTKRRYHQSSSLSMMAMSPYAFRSRVFSSSIRAQISQSLESVGNETNANFEEIPEHIASSEKLTELIKIFVNFLQITSVAVTMNLRWKLLMQNLLKAQELVVTMTNAATYLPLECSLGNYFILPASITSLWIRIAFPFMLLFLFMLAGSLHWMFVRFQHARAHKPTSQRYSARDLTSYFIVAAIAVSFFAYKDVTDDLMRTVSCLYLDDVAESDQDVSQNGPNPYLEYAIARKGYWAEDTEQICWEGAHLITGILGFMGLVFFSFGTIAFNIVFLISNKSRLPNETFISRYGFLYRSYKTYWYTLPWEAVISIRKALVSAAVVYAFPLGPNLQAVMSLGVLILAQVAHTVCWPFKEYTSCGNVPDYAGSTVNLFLGNRWRQRWISLNNQISLNHLEAMSLLVSTTTFYSGVVFYDKNTSYAGEMTMTVFVVSLNVVFFVYMAYRVYYGVHVMVNAMVTNIQNSSNVTETNIVFASEGGVLHLIRRVNQLCLYHYRQFNQRRRIFRNAPLPLPTTLEMSET